MIVWGLVYNWHDASIAVFEDKRLLFASDVERFSKIKNDPNLNQELIDYCISNWGRPEKIYYYESSLLRRTRMLYARQRNIFFTSPSKYLSNFLKHKTQFTYSYHHLSHAATSYYTSKFDNCIVLIMDAIGEWDCLSIWHGQNNNLKKIYSLKFPNSIGLFYSAMTHYIGLKPNEEEYILMGMAAYGDPTHFYNAIKNRLFDRHMNLKVNVHRGVLNILDINITSEQCKFDIAAATQLLYEQYLTRVLRNCQKIIKTENIVFGGGCALNCKANSILENFYNNVWIFPNPGDSGSSIGAVLSHTKERLELQNMYLGYNIEGKYPIEALYKDLKEKHIAFVANGPAEFGPRAFGNRSILAVPTIANINNLVNDFKQRERFRPFAPVVIDEVASQHFDITHNDYNYMQFTKPVLNSKLQSITHKDGTARIQILKEHQHPSLYKLIKRFDPPILMNTSLNIKGQPLINDLKDVAKFEQEHNVKVRTHD